MKEVDLKSRFMAFALSIVRLTERFPKETAHFIIAKQIIRSGSSSAANYRAACRGRSKPDFINKLGIVEEELDETLFWLEFLVGVNKCWEIEIKGPYNEGNELLSIVVASIKTAKRNNLKN